MIHRPDIFKRLRVPAFSGGIFRVLQKIQDKYEYSIFPLPTSQIFPKNPIFLYLSDRPFTLCIRSPNSGFFFVFAISIHIRIHIHIHTSIRVAPGNISTATFTYSPYYLQFPKLLQITNLKLKFTHIYFQVPSITHIIRPYIHTYNPDAFLLMSLQYHSALIEHSITAKSSSLSAQ